MLKQKIIALYLDRYGVANIQNPDDQNVEGIDFQHLEFVVKNSTEARSVIGQLTAIEQAAKLIWYYNTNTIKRMKAKKNQLEVQPQPISNMDEMIYNVLWPLEHFVYKRRHTVQLI